METLRGSILNVNLANLRNPHLGDTLVLQRCGEEFRLTYVNADYIGENEIVVHGYSLHDIVECNRFAREMGMDVWVEVEDDIYFVMLPTGEVYYCTYNLRLENIEDAIATRNYYREIYAF